MASSCQSGWPWCNIAQHHWYVSKTFFVCLTPRTYGFNVKCIFPLFPFQVGDDGDAALRSFADPVYQIVARYIRDADIVPGAYSAWCWLAQDKEQRAQLLRLGADKQEIILRTLFPAKVISCPKLFC
jgi:hypothetical protein